MMKAADKQNSFRTATQIIVASNSHKDMWVFTDIKTKKFYAIRTSCDWIVKNTEGLRPLGSLKTYSFLCRSH